MGRLLRPGTNCWRLARAERFAVLVDGEVYYRVLADSLAQARRSIWMLGWEFDSRTRLHRGPAPDGDLPSEIGPLLDALVRREPELTARLLIWDSALLYAVKREFGALVKMDWLTHPRLRFRLDDSHPLGASHHQKIVVIDDSLAFVGGMDVSSQRWDSRDHHPGDPRRNDPAAPTYPPFHDAMAMVTGPAAAALAEICRTRWRALSGESVPALDTPRHDMWPVDVAPLFANVPVGLSRTGPSWDDTPQVREVERLFLDMIAASRRFIFIENQYFASRRIGDALAARLAGPDCPEIAIIGSGAPLNLMERSSMGVARARLTRQLTRIDRNGRFQLYVPIVAGGEVKVHSKIAIVDDTVLRIGSANLNNRSMGLDTECDVTVDSLGKADWEAAIRRARHDLMAEHLGVSPQSVAQAESGLGSLHAVLTKVGSGRRRLAPIDGSVPGDILAIISDSTFPDPDRPMENAIWAAPDSRRHPLPGRIRALGAALAGMALVAALWHWAPAQLWALARPWLEISADLRDASTASAWVTLAFVIASLMRFPIFPLVLANAALQGPILGGILSLAGILACAGLHYFVGRGMGRARVRRMVGWQVRRVSDALARHDIAAVALLRLMPAAAFVVVNLVAGATRLRLRDFVIGTVLGALPGIFAMSVLGDRIMAVLRNPSMVNIAVLGMATALVIAAIFGLVDRLGRARPRPPRLPQEV